MTRDQGQGQDGGALANVREAPLVALLRQPNYQEQLRAALPKHLTAERFLRMTITALRQTPKLGQCDQMSVLSALFEIASLGLEPNTPLGHAYLVPFKAECQVMFGYRGYVALADRAQIGIYARWVYEGDHFDYRLGTNRYIDHKPEEDSEKRGNLRFAYAIATFCDGRADNFEVLTKADVYDRRARSQAWRSKGKDSPWGTDEAAMWRKSAIHALAPLVPMSAEFARAVQLDGQAERGVQQVIDLPRSLTLPGGTEGAADDLDRNLAAAKGELPADVQRPAASKRRPVKSQPAATAKPTPAEDEATGLITQAENLVRTLYPGNGVARAFLAHAALGEGWKDKPVGLLRSIVALLIEYEVAFNDGNQPTERQAIEELVALCRKELVKES